jgi:hypothetical protein
MYELAQMLGCLEIVLEIQSNITAVSIDTAAMFD